MREMAGNYFTFLMETFTVEVFFSIFFRERRPYGLLGKLGRSILLLAAIVVCVRLSGNSSELKMFCVILSMTIYAVAFFKVTVFWGISFAAFLVSFLNGFEVMVLYGSQVFLKIDSYRYFGDSMTAIGLLKLVELGCIIGLKRLWLKNNENRLIPKNTILFFLSSMITNLFCLYWLRIAKEHLELARFFVPYIVGILVLDIFLFFYLHSIAQRENQLQEMDRKTRERNLQLEVYRSKQELYERRARQLHDYKNHLQAIDQLLDEGCPEKARRLIGELTGELKKEADLINTNHPVVNAVLNMKYREAQEKGITISFQCNDLTHICLGEAEIVVLLGNLLDNAIEACESRESGRSVQFKMMLEEKQLVISTKNPSSAIGIVRDNGRLVSGKPDKEEHGMGTENIRAIAEKYGGIFAIREDGGYVKAAILIPNGKGIPA